MPSKPTDTGTWATNPGTTVSPLTAEKQAGFQSGKKLPARWLNWQLNIGNQWYVWLDAFESTAHTWTAIQTFAKGMNVTNDTGTLPLNVVALGASQKAANFLGGSGTAGGNSAEGTGGTGSTGDSGGGSKWTGGAIDGTVNHTGAGGKGVQAIGGAITSDVDGRRGGAAVEATGGLGEAGYGPALNSPHGDVVLHDGAINQTPSGGATNAFGDSLINGTLEVTSTAQFDGNASVGGNFTVTGSINPLGGIPLPAVTPITPLLNAPWAVSVTPSFWKNAFAEAGMRGALTTSGATNGSTAFTLPAGNRPVQTCTFVVNSDGAGKTISVSVLSNGNVVVSWDTGFSLPGIVPLDAVRFRTT